MPSRNGRGLTPPLLFFVVLLLALLLLNPPLLFAEVSETRCYITKVVYPDGTASVRHIWVDPNGIVTGIESALREAESTVVLPSGEVIMHETIQEDGTLVREEWVEVPCPTPSSEEHPSEVGAETGGQERGEVK